MSDNFYVISFEHTQPEHDFITLWRPNNSGYCWPVEWAGKYTRAQIEAQRGYYSNGESTMAVPVDVAQRLSVPSDEFSREGEPIATVLLNAAPVWKALFKAALPTTGPMREVKIKGGARWVKP